MEVPFSSVPGPCKPTILWFSGTGCPFACSSVAKEGFSCVPNNSAQQMDIREPLHWLSAAEVNYVLWLLSVLDF